MANYRTYGLDAASYQAVNLKPFSTKKQYDYSYPIGKSLKPGSPLHDHIVAMVMEMARASHGEISKRYSSWDEQDKTNTAYIWQSDEDLNVKDKDERKAVPVVVPMNYVVREALMAHLVSAFLVEPTFRYSGVGPEDVVGTILMQNHIAWQCERSKAQLSLYVGMNDAITYGIGGISPLWTEEWGPRRRWVEYEDEYGLQREQYVNNELIFEGNKLQNINPRCLLPDPNIPVQEMQDGQGWGFVERNNYYSLLETERSNPESIFNVRYLEELKGLESEMFSNRDPGRERFGTGELVANGPTTAVDVIACQPLGLDHNRYPGAVAAPTFDGYSIAPISISEMNAGLQHTLNAYFNTRLVNMETVLNDKVVADPAYVNIEDLKSNTPGKIIRLKRRGSMSRKIDEVIKQLNITDVTQQNIPDSHFIVNFMERVAGAPESMQGIMRSGPERVTATEHMDVRSSAMSRAGVLSRLYSLMMLEEIGFQMASNTIQFLSEDTYVKVKGDSDQALLKEYGVVGNKGRYSVSPFDLDARYDVSIYDASMAGAAHAQQYIDLLRVISSSELLMKAVAPRLDFYRFTMHIARLMNARDFSQFEVQAMDNEQTANLVDKGDLVPLQSELGGQKYGAEAAL